MWWVQCSCVIQSLAETGGVNSGAWQLLLRDWLQGGWLDAAQPGRASLIKRLKLISLCFHMVGCLWFLSLASVSFSHFNSFFLDISWHAFKGSDKPFWPVIWGPVLSLHLWIILPHRNLSPPYTLVPSISFHLLPLLPLIPIFSHLPYMASSSIQSAEPICIHIVGFRDAKA